MRQGPCRVLGVAMCFLRFLWAGFQAGGGGRKGPGGWAGPRGLVTRYLCDITQPATSRSTDSALEHCFVFNFGSCSFSTREDLHFYLLSQIQQSFLWLLYVVLCSGAQIYLHILTEGNGFIFSLKPLKVCHIFGCKIQDERLT